MKLNRQKLTINIDEYIRIKTKEYCSEMRMRPSDLIMALLADELEKELKDQLTKDQIKKKIHQFVMHDMEGE